MDLGRLALPLGFGNASNPELQEIFNAFYLLQRDLARSAGAIRLPCSEAVFKGQALQIFNGQLRKADRSAAKPCVAIASSDGSTTQPAHAILLQGYLGGLTGLTANTVYYLDVAGALVTVKPGAGLIQPVGYSLSTTELLVNISLP